MAGRKLTAEQRARRYAAKLEALCARPQWKRYPKRATAEFNALTRGGSPSTPSKRWHLGEDGPLSKWDPEESEDA